MKSAPPYIELHYTSGGTPQKYRVGLVSVPSNFGKGEVWYFLCPSTGRRCRKLYSVGHLFLHREAFNDVFYGSQIRSKRMRTFDRIYGPLYKHTMLCEELHKPYFKSHYAGKPTKRYIRINRELYKASQVSVAYYKMGLVGLL